MTAGFTGNTAVKDIVVTHPETRVVLERLGIDYCCGGKTSLTQAAQHAGVSVDQVLAELDRALEAGRSSDSAAIAACRASHQTDNRDIDTLHPSCRNCSRASASVFPSRNHSVNRSAYGSSLLLFVFKVQSLNVRCWMLDVGCWMFDVPINHSCFP